MQRWIRPIAAGSSLLMLIAAPQATSQERPRITRPLVIDRPGPTIRPLCTTGPSPQVQARVQNVYVQLAWPAVPGATSYSIGRSVPARSGSGVALTSSPFGGTEFWDAVPDTREAYQYTVTAFQPDGCQGSAAVAVSGPFATPNPRGATGLHPSPTQVVLTWPEQFGATGYRIDGPGIPISGLYLAGTTFEPGRKPAAIGVPRQVGANMEYELSASIAGPGVPGAWYQIVALYPEAADYNNPGKVFVPRVQPVITGISPSNGTLGQTVVTISGQYLSDPGDAGAPRISFGVSPNGATAGQPGTTATPQSVSPTSITAVAAASGYVQIGTYMAIPGGGATGSGHAVSPTTFAGSSAPPPPPPPPPQVLVPGVVGLSLPGAFQVLQNAGFVPASASGSAGPTDIVRTQSPQGGARAPRGTTVSLTSVAQAVGYSKLTLLNNMAQGRSVNVWLFDQATGAWSGGSAVGFGSTTTLNLSTGRQYFVLVLDPTKCGGQNVPQISNCEYWRLPGVPGDSKGPATTVAIN